MLAGEHVATMNPNIEASQNVPDTNSPAQLDGAEYTGASSGKVSAERESKIIYEHADMTYTGERWDQTTNTAGLSVSSARTTFWSYDVDSSNNTDYGNLWIYQMGRGQTYEDSRNKNAVRDEATWKLCDAILQNCDVPDWERHTALQNVLRRDINGFNKHYHGVDGACIGFALLELCDCPEEAEDCWVADQAVEVFRDFDQQIVESLISYVFGKYGGEN